MTPLVYHSAGEGAFLEHGLVLFVFAKCASSGQVEVPGDSVGLRQGRKFHKPSTCTSDFCLSVDSH